ncbi:hypothetical protein ACKC9G_15135 [Pokkaliibacter sp. CJK22405]|uniref:hypothetical protein n=1 Tax=Pokkaliibacter sp. CJK22405 TaxID=3384615 RepID=UPI0039850009
MDKQTVHGTYGQSWQGSMITTGLGQMIHHQRVQVTLNAAEAMRLHAAQAQAQALDAKPPQEPTEAELQAELRNPRIPPGEKLHGLCELIRLSPKMTLHQREQLLGWMSDFVESHTLSAEARQALGSVLLTLQRHFPDDPLPEHSLELLAALQRGSLSQLPTDVLAMIGDFRYLDHTSLIALAQAYPGFLPFFQKDARVFVQSMKDVGTGLELAKGLIEHRQWDVLPDALNLPTEPAPLGRPRDARELPLSERSSQSQLLLRVAQHAEATTADPLLSLLLEKTRQLPEVQQGEVLEGIARAMQHTGNFAALGMLHQQLQSRPLHEQVLMMAYGPLTAADLHETGLTLPVVQQQLSQGFDFLLQSARRLAAEPVDHEERDDDPAARPAPSALGQHCQILVKALASQPSLAQQDFALWRQVLELHDALPQREQQLLLPHFMQAITEGLNDTEARGMLPNLLERALGHCDELPAAQQMQLISLYMGFFPTQQGQYQLLDDCTCLLRREDDPRQRQAMLLALVPNIAHLAPNNETGGHPNATQALDVALQYAVSLPHDLQSEALAQGLARAAGQGPQVNELRYRRLLQLMGQQLQQGRDPHHVADWLKEIHPTPVAGSSEGAVSAQQQDISTYFRQFFHAASPLQRPSLLAHGLKLVSDIKDPSLFEQEMQSWLNLFRELPADLLTHARTQLAAVCADARELIEHHEALGHRHKREMLQHLAAEESLRVPAELRHCSSLKAQLRRFFRSAA